MFLLIWDFLCKGLKWTCAIQMFLLIWDSLCEGLKGTCVPLHRTPMAAANPPRLRPGAHRKGQTSKSTCCETATKLKHWFLWVQLLTLVLKTHAKPAVYKTTLWPQNPVNTGLGYTADIVKAQKCPEFGPGNCSIRNHACNSKVLALPAFAYS